MYLPIDGPGVYGNLAVTTTPTELKVGASALKDRKVVSALPIDGTVYWGFDNSVSSSTGKPIFQHQDWSREAGPLLQIYFVTASGTVNVRITEEA